MPFHQVEHHLFCRVHGLEFFGFGHGLSFLQKARNHFMSVTQPHGPPRDMAAPQWLDKCVGGFDAKSDPEWTGQTVEPIAIASMIAVALAGSARVAQSIIRTPA